MKKNLVAIIITLIAVPVLVYAQATPTTPTQGITSLGTFVDTITSSVVRALATLFLAGAVAAFFFGIVKYLIGAHDGDSKKIEAGNQFMLWGLIAIFVMFSVWGIVKYAQGILGLPSSSSIDIPQVKFNTGGGTNPTNPTSPTGECGGKANGVSCQNGSGTCQNQSCVIGGLPSGECAGKTNGTTCQNGSGTCQNNACSIHSSLPTSGSCTASTVGQSCQNGAGVCKQSSDDGSYYCGF